VANDVCGSLNEGKERDWVNQSEPTEIKKGANAIATKGPTVCYSPCNVAHLDQFKECAKIYCVLVLVVVHKGETIQFSREMEQRGALVNPEASTQESQPFLAMIRLVQYGSQLQESFRDVGVVCDKHDQGIQVTRLLNVSVVFTVL
jgi:hypothetical protein